MRGCGHRSAQIDFTRRRTKEQKNEQGDVRLQKTQQGDVRLHGKAICHHRRRLTTDAAHAIFLSQTHDILRDESTVNIVRINPLPGNTVL